MEEKESVEKDTEITLLSTSTQVLAEHEPEPAAAVVNELVKKTEFEQLVKAFATTKSRRRHV